MGLKEASFRPQFYQRIKMCNVSAASHFAGTSHGIFYTDNRENRKKNLRYGILIYTIWILMRPVYQTAFATINLTHQ